MQEIDDRDIQRFENKIDLVIKLLAYGLIKDKEYRDQVSILSNIGLQPKEIAVILGKTANNVNVTLSLIRKAKSKKA